MPLMMENRFGIMITLVIFITLMYGAEAIALSGQNTLDNPEVEVPTFEEQQRLDEVSEILGVEGTATMTPNTDLFGQIAGLWGFLTFAPLGLPVWANWVVLLMMTVVLFSLAMITASLIYDFVKGLPFT